MTVVVLALPGLAVWFALCLAWWLLLLAGVDRIRSYL